MEYFKPIADSDQSSARSSGCCSSGGKSPDLRIPLSRNTLLNGFLFTKLIGRGSFSLVYAAVEMSTGADVVIKEYYPKHYGTRRSNSEVSPLKGKKQIAFNEGFKQFFNEAMALKRIRHPNLLSTHQFFNANNTAYLVSLNQSGRDLRWFLSSFRESLDEASLYKIFLPILSALSFLHRSNLLHLDLKPANILLQPNGESLLLDLGAAQRIDSPGKRHRKPIVTHGFAPPEQYERNGEMGAWTDIYAVGASLYCCLARRRPVKSKGSGVVSGLDVDKYGTFYQSSLIKAINRSLSSATGDRYQTIDEFAAALLEDTEWATLLEYEASVMAYDRFSIEEMNLQNDPIRSAA